MLTGSEEIAASASTRGWLEKNTNVFYAARVPPYVPLLAKTNFTFLEGGSISIILSAIDSVTDESLTEVVFGSDQVRETYRAMADRHVPFEAETPNCYDTRRPRPVGGALP